MRFSPAPKILHILSVHRVSALLIVGGAVAHDVTGAETAAAPLSLDAAVTMAEQRNPGLARLRADAAAMDAVPPQRGALPDPVLSLNAANLPTDTFDLDQEPMTQIQLSITQSLPFPGKRRLRRSVAEHAAAAAHHRYAEGRLALVADVRAGWWTLFQLDRAVEIVTRNQRLMRDFVEIAHTRYRVGDGLQQDVLLAQLEQSRLAERQLGLEGRRRAAAARLNALLDRPGYERLRLADAPPNDRLPDLPPTATLITRAHAARPLLETQRTLLDAADSQLDLTRREAYPDLRVGAGYGYRRGRDPLRDEPRPDFFSVMLSIDLPLHYRSKQGKAIEQRMDERSGQRLALDDALRTVEGEITAHCADYEAARRKALLLRDTIVPQAQQTVSSMLAGYQVNKVDFLNVISAQITLYNAQIDYYSALAEAKQTLARLASVVGTEALYE